MHSIEKPCLANPVIADRQTSRLADLSRRLIAASIAAVLVIVSSAGAKAQEPESQSERGIDTKNMFGFTSGTDVGLAGERELELETDLAFQKRAGSYNAVEQNVIFEFSPSDAFEIDATLLGAYDQISRVDGLANRTEANFDGLATKFNYVFVQRSPSSPIGLTVWIEPAWTRIDDAGKLNKGFSAETRIILDTELVPDRLFAALNLIYAPQISHDFGAPGWTRSADLGVSGALAYALETNVLLGAELEYFRAYNGLTFGTFAGNALYFGPTLYVRVNKTVFVGAAISTQIAGNAAGDPNHLDLTNFSRNKAELTIGIEF
ncbi:MAG: hypothetical protein WDN46_15640 [Methylocella sp.]